MIAEVPDGPPAWFQWRRATHTVMRVEGPERVAMEWWRSEAAMLTRDYFRVEDEAGLRFWLYRDGLYDREIAQREGDIVLSRTGSCMGCSHEPTVIAYAEIGITTNFSFLRGGSHPQEYVQQAGELRLSAIGIADHNTLAGVVRAHKELENPELVSKPKLLIGSRLVFIDGTPDILVYPRDRAAYGRLCQLLTRGKRGDDADKTEKGECRLSLDDLLEFAEGQLLVLTLPHRFEPATALQLLDRLQRSRADGVWLAASLLYRGDDRRRLARLQRLAATAARAAAGDQRGAVSPSRAPPAAGCARPAFARRPPSTPSAGGSKPMPNAISSRRTKWRGCFATRRRRSRKPCGLPAASISRSISSNTSIPTSRCRRARPRSAIWKT